MLPAEVIALIGGAATGASEPMFPLLTVDVDGYPWPCWLSRRELLADPETVWIAVRSRRARADLERSGRATLIVIGARVAYGCRLSAATVTTTGGGIVLAALDVVGVDADDVGTPLTAPGFVAGEQLLAREGADDHTQILARFAAEDRARQRLHAD